MVTVSMAGRYVTERMAQMLIPMETEIPNSLNASVCEVRRLMKPTISVIHARKIVLPIFETAMRI